jgi:cytochrome c553
MYTPRPSCLAFATLLGFLSPLACAGPADEGRQRAYTCTACHGQHGQQTAPGMPVIGGRDAHELLAAMARFRTGKRWHPAMNVMMLSLDEAAMVDIAEYFAQIDPAVLHRPGPYGVAR